MEAGVISLICRQMQDLLSLRALSGGKPMLWKTWLRFATVMFKSIFICCSAASGNTTASSATAMASVIGREIPGIRGSVVSVAGGAASVGPGAGSAESDIESSSSKMLSLTHKAIPKMWQGWQRLRATSLCTCSMRSWSP